MEDLTYASTTKEYKSGRIRKKRLKRFGISILASSLLFGTLVGPSCLDMISMPPTTAYNPALRDWYNYEVRGKPRCGEEIQHDSISRRLDTIDQIANNSNVSPYHSTIKKATLGSLALGFLTYITTGTFLRKRNSTDQ